MTFARRSPIKPIVFAVVALGALAAAGGLIYLFLRGAPPPAVSVGSPAPGASGGATTAPLPSGAAATLGAEGLDGTWTIDPSIGSFADFSSSFVGYRVDETFTDQSTNTAVGRTPDVSGTLTLDGSTITAVDVTADLTNLQSDDDRRDGQLRRQAIEIPTSTFRLTSRIDLGSIPTDGSTMSAAATGELTLHGVTKTVEVPIQATLNGDVVTVLGQIDILFADYDIERPTSFLVLSIEDNGIMEFQLHFRKG